MLIRFRVSNFLSFRDEVEFSMIPGASQHHPDHIIPAGKSGIDVLRCGVIYGANASGKSNLIKSVEFARDFIVEGLKPNQRIPLKPFKLDHAFEDKPAKFEFEFCVADKSYLYGFELIANTVQAEWLYELKKTTEKMVFERRTNDQGKAEVEFGLQLTKKRLEFMQKFSAGTRPNQLFLTKCYEDNDVNYFNDVSSWFRNLQIIFPSSKYGPWLFQTVDEADISKIVNYLEAFDTGVCGFSTQEINPEDTIPAEILEDFKSDKEKGMGVVIDLKGLIYILRKKEDAKIFVGKIVFRHHTEDCDSDTFLDMDEESDGTLRLIDLTPPLFLKDTVFLVDELDRSLHPSLSYRLIELFLKNQNNSQLIVTTHEAHLLDLELLRRDEIWFIEKDRKGASTLYSLEEFTPRHDKDVQKGYLLGRFGAIPVMRDIDFSKEEG